MSGSYGILIEVHIAAAAATVTAADLDGLLVPRRHTLAIA